MEILSDLITLWRDMAQMLNAKDLDPSYYGAFKDILNDWLTRSSAANLVQFTEVVRLELERLSESVALSTGMSMALIWEVARPILPSTEGQWHAFDQLLSLTEALDNNIPFQFGRTSPICSR
jgi:midasin (ATPase involved in ribosome maturation)